MRRFGQLGNLLDWPLALLLAAFVAGCGGGAGTGGNSLPPDVTPLVSAAKTITAYSLAGVTGTINESAKTIAVTDRLGPTLHLKLQLSPALVSASKSARYFRPALPQRMTLPVRLHTSLLRQTPQPQLILLLSPWRQTRPKS